MTQSNENSTLKEDEQLLEADANIEDSLDDASRRALLTRLTRAGAAAVPLSIVLMDQAKAQNTGGNSGGGLTL